MHTLSCAELVSLYQHIVIAQFFRGSFILFIRLYLFTCKSKETYKTIHIAAQAGQQGP